VDARFRQGFRRLADPKISLASFSGLFLGACMAAADHAPAWGWLALTVLGVFCVEVAKNAAGELVDFDSGTELAVALAYGPLVVGGTYLVQTGRLSAPVLQASLALGVLVAAFLWINQFPDYRADRQSGKRNLVVRLGPERAANGYVVICAVGYLWLTCTALYYPGARGLLGGLAGLPLALFSCWRLLGSAGVTARLVPAQAAALGSFVLMAAGAGLGCLLTG